MKIRITGPGIFGANGELPIDTEITISREPPAGWAGKYEIVSGDAPAEAVPVVNPARDPLDHDGVRGGSMRGSQSIVTRGRAKAAAKD